MNQSKVHSSQGNVPFAWENQPGVSKIKDVDVEARTPVPVKLPPPPCQLDPSSPKVLGQEMHVPLPPCPFPAPLRTSSGKGGLRKGEDDPFLAAYRECTKSVKQPGQLSKNGSKRFGGGSRSGGLFSCKHSCGVREDSLVKVSHISPPPLPLPREDEKMNLRNVSTKYK